MDPLRGGPGDRFEIRTTVVGAGAPPIAVVPRLLDVVEASERGDRAEADGIIAAQAEGDQAVDGFVGVDALQRAEGDIALGRVGKRGETRLGIAEAGERGDGGVRQTVVLALGELGFVGGPLAGRGEDGRGGILRAEALEADDGLKADARVGIIQGIHEELDGHAFELRAAVGERAQGELADGGVLGEDDERGVGLGSDQLFVGEDRGDAGVDVLRSGLRDREDGRGELGLVAVDDLALSLEALDGGLRGELLHEVGVGELGDVDVDVGLHILGGDELHGAVRVVDRLFDFLAVLHDLLGQGLAFTQVLETAAAPVGEEEAGVAVDIEVGGARDLLEGLLLGHERGLEAGDRVAMQRAGRPVAGEEGFAEVAGEAGLAQVEAAGAGAAAVVGERMGDLVVEVLVQTGIAGVRQRGEVVEARVPALAIVGIVAGEEVQGRGDRDIADVTGHRGVDLELGAVRADAHDAATVECHPLLVAEADGAGVVAQEARAEVTDGDVEPAIDAHAGTVGGVVSAAGVFDAATEAVDEQGALGIIVGLTVAVLVLELREERRVDEVENAADVVAAAGALDLGVFDDLIGNAGALRVAGDQDAAHARGMAEGAVLIRRDVDVAIGGGR